MNKMQEHLKMAADQLGLRVIIGPIIKFKSGKKIAFEAYFPDLSNKRGIYVVQFSDAYKLDKFDRDELLKSGVGLSTFDCPEENEEFCVESYVEMFREWGWSGNVSDKPEWTR